jgi:CRP/FNR family cyclic AMP-dependent transcriptional regulator
MARAMTDASVFELLRLVPLFADVPAADLEVVARKSQTVWKPRGARVLEEGSPADCGWVLTAGRAKVVISGSGAVEVILGILEPPVLIGEIALLDHSTRSAGLVTIERSHFIKIPAAVFLELRNNGAFEDKLVAHVTATLRRATEQLRAIYTYSSLERVVWCLARLARQRGTRLGSEIAISPRPPHQEIAEMTGCSRETVSRVLLRLRRMKWVTWDKQSLRLQVAAFRRYAADVQMPFDV